MSAPYERPTLAPSLYAYAEGLRDSAPDAPLPHGGLPLPESARPPRDPAAGLGAREARLALPGLLRPFLADPDPERAAVGMERALAATPVREQAVFAALPPPRNPSRGAGRGRPQPSGGGGPQGVSGTAGVIRTPSR
ncbi:hypothetical protein [Streptomyces sp. Qhu_M48]|uniref:hypothetical protein n=1 Tax=Streptomyces sp. Qhu_M48 TaxID=3435889 RepID=UPI003F503C7F